MSPQPDGRRARVGRAVSWGEEEEVRKGEERNHTGLWVDGRRRVGSQPQVVVELGAHMGARWKPGPEMATPEAMEPSEPGGGERRGCSHRHRAGPGGCATHVMA